MTPPSAAMPADNANAYTLASATLMPSDAAARSLSRTAISRRPTVPRRTLLTARPARVRAASTTTPYRPGCSTASMSTPNRLSESRLVPLTPPVSAELVSTSSVTITASPNVRTARLTPRVRSAGMATTPPSNMVARMPTGTASSKGHPAAAIRRDETQTPKPASAICASDSCPTYPTTSTSEMATIETPRLVARAVAQSSGTTSRSQVAAISSGTIRLQRTRPEPRAGIRSRTSLRSGSARPLSTSTTTMMRNAADRETDCAENWPRNRPDSSVRPPSTPSFAM